MSRHCRRLLAGLCVLLGSSAQVPGLVRAADAGVRPTAARLASDGPADGGQCSYSLSSTGASFASIGFVGASVTVTTGSSCSWTAVSNAPWITITSGASGTGLSWVTYNVAFNSTNSVRTGTMTIAGITYTVTQAAGSCSYTLSSTSASFPSTGFTGASVTVTTGSLCSWTATSNASWLTITEGASHTGLGWVSYNVAPNSTGSVRTGTLTIAGITYTVTQAANSCSYTLSATSGSYPSTGFTGATVSVTTGSSCSWTATSNASWITITEGASHTGLGWVTFDVAPNPTSSARTGTMTIAGMTFTATQAAGSCSYTLSSTGGSYPSTGFTGASVSVTTGSSCSWTATSNASWITITEGASHTGLGWVTFTVAPNPTSSARTGTLTIAGLTFTVTQAAGSCTFNLSASSTSVPATASSGTVSVSTASGCSWNASSNAAWITVATGATGSGSGTVGYDVAANTTTSTRTGTLTIAGKTFTVSQAAATPPGAPRNVRIIK